MEKAFQHTEYPPKKVEKQKSRYHLLRSHSSAARVQIQVPESLTKDKGLALFGAPISIERSRLANFLWREGPIVNIWDLRKHGWCLP